MQAESDGRRRAVAPGPPPDTPEAGPHGVGAGLGSVLSVLTAALVGRRELVGHLAGVPATGVPWFAGGGLIGELDAM